MTSENSPVRFSGVVLTCYFESDWIRFFMKAIRDAFHLIVAVPFAISNRKEIRCFLRDTNWIADILPVIDFACEDARDIVAQN